MMSRHRSAAIAAALMLTATTGAHAKSPFTGTWKNDLTAMKFPAKPETWTIKDGVYHCATCTPPYSVKADGGLHPVAGRAFMDEMSVTIVDPRTVKLVMRKQGKAIYEDQDRASEDGKTLVSTFTDHSGAKEASTGEDHYTRVGPTPAGAHATSGSWRQVSTSASDNALTMTVVEDGPIFALGFRTGENYKARLGGPFVPYKGTSTATLVAVEHKGPNAVLQRLQQKGKLVGTYLLTVTPDGHTMNVVYKDLQRGTTTLAKLTKQ